MLFENIAYFNEDFDIVKNSFILVDGKYIKYIGKTKPENYTGESYNGRGKLLTPAFVNAHTHSAMTLLRGYGSNLPLDRWLNDKVFPFEDKIKGKDAYYATLLAEAEMLRCGTASFSDMYFFCDNVCKAVSESKMKCNFSRGLTSFEYTSLEKHRGFNEAISAYQAYHNSENGKLKIDFSIHAEYTSNENFVRAVANYIREFDTIVHIHMSETKKEHEECKLRHNGKTPAEYFFDTGIFDNKTLAAHCVWVEPQDIEIMREKDVSCSANPASNMKLGSGIANIYELKKAGINIAIGTDSVCSNNNLNILKEIYLTALLQKAIHFDATLISEKEVIKMATVNGYKAQGRENCGIIKENYYADLAVFDISKENMVPDTDTACNFIYSANGSDCVLTMVDGEVLYKDGEFKSIDIEKVKYEVQKSTSKILGELNV